MKKRQFNIKRSTLKLPSRSTESSRHRQLFTTRFQSILSIRGLKRMVGKNTAKFPTSIWTVRLTKQKKRQKNFIDEKTKKLPEKVNAKTAEHIDKLSSKGFE
jgi:hypothetical protein